MIPSTVLSNVASLPAAAVVVAVGVLGVIDVRRRLRTRVHPALRGTSVRPAAAREVLDQPARVPVVGVMDDVPDRMADDAKDTALRLLDAWSARPRSAWDALGMQCLVASHHDAGITAASQVILEGVVAHHASPLDAWIVRDAAETAWMLAPRDRTSLPLAIEDAARRAVLHAALAVLARSWLPHQDFTRLVARAAY